MPSGFHAVIRGFASLVSDLADMLPSDGAGAGADADFNFRSSDIAR